MTAGGRVAIVLSLQQQGCNVLGVLGHRIRFRSVRIAVVDAAAIAYRLSMQLRRTVGAAGEGGCLFAICCFVLGTGEIAPEPSKDSRVMQQTNFLSYRRRPKKILGFLPQPPPPVDRPRLAGLLDGERDV